MKRCPQCEFIYEDEQSLCDMDGVLLVFDSRTLPNPGALAPVPVTPKAQRRTRAVPAFATVILALVLGMVYYVSTHRNRTVHTDSPPPSAASTLSAVAPSNPTPEPAATTEEITPKEELAKEEAPKPTVAKSRAMTPVAKAPAVKATATPQTKKPEEKKEESKVGSILKKTGRILKKPFKF